MLTNSKHERLYNRSSRKIHLDFHTPHWVSKVGEHYDPEMLVRTWKAAAVNAVTVVFGLCACGNAYYEGDEAPVHPSLQGDMLRPLLAAAKKEEIEIFVHFGPGINDRSVIKHPEWAMLTREGRLLDTEQGRHWGWACYNSPFLEQRFYPQLREFVRLFPEVAGVFLDMVVYPEGTCFCPHCKNKAIELNLDINNSEQHDHLIQLTLNKFMESSRQIVKAASPAMLFTCNSQWYVGGARSEQLDFIELEAPVTWNAYHFPVMARYIRTLPVRSGGMTTRFPFNWGFFGGLTSAVQMSFEAAEMMATLGACCVGDQLHPDGTAEPGVYELIGGVYRDVITKEPWTLHAKSVPYIGVLADPQRNSNGHTVNDSYYSPQQSPASFYGAGLTLLEGSMQFDVIDINSELDAYKLIWLAENKTLDDALIPRLDEFVGRGGRLLISGSGLWHRHEWCEWLEKVTGLHYKGSLEGGMYVQPQGAAAANGVLPIPYMVKGECVQLEADEQLNFKQQLLAEVIDTYEHIPITKKFGHYHPPAGNPSGLPGIMLMDKGAGAVAVVCAPIAEYYYHSGSHTVRQLMLNVISAMLPASQRIIEVEQAHASVEVSLMEQPDRWILHLIQYAAKRSTGPTVIEEPTVREAIAVTLRPKAMPNRVYMAPEMTPLQWTKVGGCAIRIVVPKLYIHAMAVLEF
jgi:hypothetical protein